MTDKEPVPTRTMWRRLTLSPPLGATFGAAGLECSAFAQQILEYPPRGSTYARNYIFHQQGARP